MNRRVVPFLLAGAVLGASGPASAAPVPQKNAGELALAVARLRVVGTVLYVAAHPDDENSRLLSYLVGERGLRTAYLSVTRGDGGQNLLGAEQGPMFGLLRRAELLEARRIDGAEQYFTRAVDFGYSKSTAESLEMWGHDEILADMVGVVRDLWPDVIITRFSPDDAMTHGHHSASAVLAREAFAAAADPARFADSGQRPWKATRLLWNKSTWSKPEGADWSNDLPADVGGYSPLLGASWGEIAGRSRSMHKSQGFGAEQQRGPILEYFELLGGEPPTYDFLSGIDFTWKRAGGNEERTNELIDVLRRASETLDPGAPHEIIPLLLDARSRIRALGDTVWKWQKLRELDDVIAACAGLWLDATADRYRYSPGDEVEVTATALNRSPYPIELAGVYFGEQLEYGAPLERNETWTLAHRIAIPHDAADSTPAWLREAPDGARYRMGDEGIAGATVQEPGLAAVFDLRIGDERIRLTRHVDFRWVDPVDGERRRPLEIQPAVTVEVDRPVMVFPDGEARDVRVTARTGRGDVQGRVLVELPEGWSSEPAEAPLELAARDDEASFVFRILPPAGARAVGQLRAVADVQGHRYTHGLRRIEYPHIPIQTTFPAAEARLVRVDLERGISRVGYIGGAGDDVARSLADVGYDVVTLDDDALSGDLGAYDAIVTGVRAFNVNPRLHVHHRHLMDYVEGGGTLVVQYNTVNRISGVDGPVGPFPFEITRDRVTDETSPVRFDDDSDPVFHHPNEITADDFDGWVQERGLYFATTDDARYRRPLALHDPGEDWHGGALLVAAHGKGRFVYTGLSFFRQLPAGVPGALRLFANLLAPAEGGEPRQPAAAAPAEPGEERADDQAGVRH